MTLVELIVTFAVAAIFMAAAAMLVVPATKVTLEVKAMNRVHDDAAIIMETIVNELSYAEPYIDSTGTVTSIQLTDPVDGYYQTVKYNDKGGNSAVMRVTTDSESGDAALVGKGKLLIAYDQIVDDDGTSIREEIDWSYGKGLYRDNEITLGFQKKPDENIIVVSLTVTNMTSDYSYPQETYIRCISVTADEIQEVP